MALRWQDRSFSELSIVDLHAILALRARVFVVEQACAYLDVDGLDPVARHVWADGEPSATIAAYLRVLPAGAKYAEASLGRVVTAPEYRGTGLGRQLVQRGLAVVGAAPVRIGAQLHLERFYAELGFRRVGEPYDEDGIPHLEMLRAG